MHSPKSSQAHCIGNKHNRYIHQQRNKDLQVQSSGSVSAMMPGQPNTASAQRILRRRPQTTKRDYYGGALTQTRMTAINSLQRNTNTASEPESGVTYNEAALLRT